MSLKLLLLFALLGIIYCSTTFDLVGDSEFEHVGRSLFTYHNANDTYVPNANVLNGHRLTNMKFATNMAYGQKVLTLPIFLFALGFVSLFFLNIGLCFRCCCQCCRCEPAQSATGKLRDINDAITGRNYLIIKIAFAFLCLATLLTDQLVFIGNTDINSGVMTTNKALTDLTNIFVDLNTDSSGLVAASLDLTANLAAAKLSCSQGSSQLDDLDGPVAALYSSSTGFHNDVHGIPPVLDMGHTYINTYAVGYRNIALYVLWGLAILSVLVFIICQIANTKAGMKFAMFFGMFSFFIIIILCVPWMTMTSAMADLCMAPSYNVVMALPSGVARNLVNYYVTCNGPDVLGELLDVARNSTAVAAGQMQAISTNLCPNDPNLALMSSDFLSISAYFGAMEHAVRCERLQAVWFELINTSVCGGLYNGIYSIWVSQFTTSFFLFFLILVASIVYQYYGRLASVAPILASGEEGAVAQAEMVPGVAVLQVEKYNHDPNGKGEALV